ncbi:Ferredoxin subunit of nitrite reductase or a ring-hydroxylating dioxygenase [Marinobacter antarcticus]|uniref:Ferredoxin subunit of nitrite reductase or a ring-hydroxylating dioxygenase n=1 Tax=Marinobacter antarcticus TaxID=564117 RepID=A0A1M6P1M2_9GAMM|nr:Rieske 2Fe-2S domain-containing protein [Marinobacter antarcticus]SHK01831.1 Ferredoxin subunit of nitrite reductase or a ring-hydroxylating dioxygenase [Marinobacter antarcticus]
MTDRQADQWQTVCSRQELQVGRFIEFSLASADQNTDTLPTTGFVFLDSTTPRAYLNQCPHMGIELNWMPGRFMDADNLFLQCSTHGALFKPGDGECIAGPCQGDALIALDIRETGEMLEVRLPE